jgi:hypothetical protein
MYTTSRHIIATTLTTLTACTVVLVVGTLALQQSSSAPHHHTAPTVLSGTYHLAVTDGTRTFHYTLVLHPGR